MSLLRLCGVYSKMVFQHKSSSFSHAKCYWGGVTKWQRFFNTAQKVGTWRGKYEAVPSHGEVTSINYTERIPTSSSRLTHASSPGYNPNFPTSPCLGASCWRNHNHGYLPQTSSFASGGSVFASPTSFAQRRSSRFLSTFNIYQAGLRHTEFTNELTISKESQTIPIFRALDVEGNLMGNCKCPFSKEQLLDMYTFMVRLSVVDNIMYNIQRQGRISFYIQNQGEEAVQTGVSSALSIEDNLFCQYRELGVLMWRGFTIEDALNQCFSNEGDDGKGRQMPISYSKKSINLHAISTPLTTQVPHASGAGYAFKIDGEKRCAVAFFGEGAASEGDFHGAMNFAATLKCQTLFICRNNCYAISTPVKDQYAGDGIAIRGVAYGMETVRVDGNDLFAVAIATQKARDICVNTSQPVCMEFMTYRMGHHSTSDDSSQYRPTGEMEAWSESGVHPIARVEKYLENQGWWTKEQKEHIEKEARTETLNTIKTVEKKKHIAIVPGIFDDVYAETPWHLKEQAAGLKSHLERYKSNYDVTKYKDV